MDSGLMIQTNIHLVVFKVDSTWTEWSPSGLHQTPGGVQPECVGECKCIMGALNGSWGFGTHRGGGVKWIVGA
jgi:hypothetical protein